MKKCKLSKNEAILIESHEQLDQACQKYNAKSACKFICTECGAISYTELTLLKYRAWPLLCGTCQRKQTCLDRYGVTNGGGSAEAVAKIKATKLDRYGDARYNNTAKLKETVRQRTDEETQDIVRRRQETRIKKYGEKQCSEAGLARIAAAQHENSAERVAKIKATKAERYGDANYNNSTLMLDTRQRRYGSAGYHNIEQMRKTNLERYGVEFYSSSDECKTKVRNTCIARFGSESYLGTKECRDKTMEYNLRVYGVPYYSQTDEAKKKTEHTCLLKYGTTYPVGHFSKGRSDLEDEIVNVLRSCGYACSTNNRKILSGKEIDILIPDKNICIEVQGTYWHCDPRFYSAEYYNKGADKTAEQIWSSDKQKKTLIESLGYSYYAVWEYDWRINKEETIQRLKDFIHAK